MKLGRRRSIQITKHKDHRTPWYLAGGAPTPLAVYEPRTANTLSESYVNIVNSGTHDGDFSTVPPTLGGNGWVSDGTAYGNTGITPTGNYSILCKISGWGGAALSSNTVMGQNTTGAQQLIIPRRLDSVNRYIWGVSYINVSLNIDGVVALCSNNVFHDGVSVGTVTSAFGTPSETIGLMGFNGDTACPAIHTMEFAAIWDVDVSAYMPEISAALAEYSATLPDLPAQLAPIVQTPNEFQVVQQSDIPISGNYVRETPEAIECSWAGGAYATVDATPEAEAWSGVLAGSAGQGTLRSRWVDYIANIHETNNVGIGDNFILAGQSNMGEVADNNQSYSHATIKPSTLARLTNTWRELGSTELVESLTKSCWPLVATAFMASQNAPVCFAQTSEGSTSISEWQSPGAYYSRITAQYAKMVNAKAVLLQIGETDAPNDMSTVDFQTYLDAFVSSVYSDTGLDTFIAKLHTSPSYSSTQRDTINAGVAYVIANNAHALAGPDFSDYTTATVHFQTDEEISVQSSRWWTAIQTAYGW